MILKRIMSFLMDIFIVNVLVSLITVFIPISSNYENLNTQLTSVSTSYLEGTINEREYLDSYYSLQYYLEKETIPITLISLVISIVYFAILPFYNDGQTIGKKFNKLKVVRLDSKKLEMNDLVIRNLVNNGVFISLIQLGLIFVVKTPKIMCIISIVLSSMQSIIMIISLLLIIFTKKKQGIHGIISNTEVVEV